MMTARLNLSGAISAGPPVRTEEPRRALTAARGVAAWWVVVFHFRESLPSALPSWVARLAGSGYLAVDFFFILSGYVIALNYAAWFNAGPIRARRYLHFLELRLSRVYPVHLFMLVLFPLLTIATRLFGHSRTASGLHVGYYLLSFPLLQAWGMFDGPTWNVPAWSISTEWLAYLVFPILVVPAVRLCRTPLAAASILLLLLAALAVAAANASPDGLGNVAGTFPPVRCVLEFSAGIVLFYFGVNRRRIVRETWLALLLAALCCAAYAGTNAPDYMLIPLAFAGAVHALADETTRLTAWLRGRALQWLGVVSYSTYMSHYFLKICIKLLFVKPGVPVWLPFVAYVAVVLAASALLHVLIERPSQRVLRQYLTSRQFGGTPRRQ